MFFWELRRIKMSNYGATLSRIRKNKNLSLVDASAGIVSDSFLGKFEKGKTEMSFSKLVRIIQHLNVSLEEFLYLDNKQEDDFTILLGVAGDAYVAEDIIKLHELANEQLQQYHATKLKSYRCNSIMVEGLLADLTDTEIDEEARIFLSEYLIGIDNWTAYELTLFSNASHLLTDAMLTSMSAKILEKTEELIGLAKNKRIFLETLLNLTRIFIEKDNKKHAQFLLNVITSIKKDETLYFIRTNLLFLTGLFHLRFADKALGMQQCDDAVKVMQILDDPNLAAQKQKYLKGFLKKCI
ncbi:Rgg/GadR/MutR family transcriptional regulator [Periweissella cryptocerci]|uniref:Rgg/GadR/MutR family transcriptional regulator n=2 Tax=Periweissella cryptocerci TaxID=2506420 RepID=A0A4P6YV29_9LACO|nr:Rgg/GadR/MutR family transcriptional regulator [Periweissella cryptocerci]